MASKLFALAGFTALTGLVFTVAAAGCSSSTTSPGTDDASTTDAKKDVAKVDAEPEDTGPTTCPTTAAIDTSTYPWKPPAIDLGKCTEAELTGLVNYLENNPTSTYADWKSKAGIGAQCQGCMFGPDGTTWKPFVEASGALSELNVGGCVMIASTKDLAGKAEACGKAYQNYFDCRLEACQDCPDDSTSFSKCVTAASKGACKAATDAVGTQCGASVNDYIDACSGEKYVFEGAIKAQCIAGLGANDGG